LDIEALDIETLDIETSGVRSEENAGQPLNHQTMEITRIIRLF
jgi:hypothetical protein